MKDGEEKKNIFPEALTSSQCVSLGEPFKILSGDIQYFRMRRNDWEQRLKMAKILGLNTITTYIEWSLHEPNDGQFDFYDEKDIVAFLKLVSEVGMFAIIRLGPYITAERGIDP